MPEPKQQTIRILAVDDDWRILAVYKKAFSDGEDRNTTIQGMVTPTIDEGNPLGPYHCEIDLVESGEEGIKAVEQAEAEENPYRVMLLDMRMPGGMDGLVTAEAVRALDSKLRIILVTAYSDYSLVEIRNRIGFGFDYLTKPFSIDHLRQLVLSNITHAEQLLMMEHYQQALVGSNSRLQDFAESTSDWFWETDEEHRFIYFSSTLEQATGFIPSDLIGKRRDEIAVTGVNQDQMKPHLDQLKRHEPFDEFVYSHETDGKGAVWLSISGKPLFDEAGHFEGYRGSGKNITERYQREAESARMREELDRAQQMAKVGSWSIDFTTRSRIASDEALKIYQLSADEIAQSNEPIRQRIHPDDQARVQRTFREAITQHTPYQAEFRLLMAAGEIKYVKEHALIQYSREGVPQTVHGTVQDISESANLSHRYQTMLDGVQNGIHILDLNGNIVECSRSFAMMLGYTMAEAMQLNVKSWDCMIPQDQVIDKVRQLAVSAETFETQWRHSNGTILDVEVTAGGIEFSGTQYIFATGRDIGERKAMEANLNAAVADAEQANHAKDEFLASMSHELRTPLTSIIGNSELLNESALPQECRNIVASIERAGRCQLTLVNDILDISKIESGKFVIDQHPFNFASMLSDLQQLFKPQAQEAGLEFTIDSNHQEKKLLLGDANRIRQVLLNLVSNALKFTERGGVTLTTSVDMGQLCFEVKDSGIGMSTAVIARLFSRFEQADRSISRRFGGSGLGLYISQNLAKLMGGEITVSSMEGVGSTFTLRLPYQPSAELVPVERSSNKVQIEQQQEISGTILVAEDTIELQLLVRRMLEGMGAIVTIANNGIEAVEQLQQQSFDLVLMDMQMPVMDGIEATRRIRAAGNRVPLYALTANMMQKHRDAFEAAGCDGFLGKPINKELLKAVVMEHLTTRATQTSSTPLQPSTVVEEVDDEMMAIFYQSMAERKAALIKALSQQDWEEVRNLAHAAKGSAASFGFGPLSEQAAAIQHQIDDGEVADMKERVMDLVIEMGKTIP